MTPFDGALVWKIKATHGLPLDVIFDRLAREDMVPTWKELFDAARADGCNMKKLVEDCRFFVKEAYPAEVAAIIAGRLHEVA